MLKMSANFLYFPPKLHLLNTLHLTLVVVGFKFMQSNVGVGSSLVVGAAQIKIKVLCTFDINYKQRKYNTVNVWPNKLQQSYKNLLSTSTQCQRSISLLNNFISTE